MVTLTILTLILLVVVIGSYMDLSSQLKAYEQQKREHRETISQIASASKKSNKVAPKRSIGKSEGSRVQGKKDTKSNKSKS